jgi:phospholipid/cholesterol/gamma-HCH transport system permease protein
VNEEVAALQTLGISPMTMLVLPRLAAAVLVMPVLTLFLELAGLLGMLTVMLAFGFSPSAVATQLGRAVHGRDLWGGLFKAVCFGAAIAGIGCRAGLATGIGPRAVGQAATAAVVGGIVATILLDGLFAILFYRLGV